MKIHPHIFLKEALLFCSTLALGLITAFRYSEVFSGSELVQPSSVTTEDLIIFIGIIFGIWVISRIPRLGSGVFWTILSLIVFSGTQVVMTSLAPYPWDLLATLLILITFLFLGNVLVHDIAIVTAIAGMGAVIGLMVTPMLVIIAFVALSFYDIIAVYKTRHMVQMARSMIESGAIFGFIIPPKFRLFLASRHEAKSRVGEDFMILGSGDITLPLIFASSLVRQSMAEAIIVASFSILGLLMTHILFVNQGKRQAMAALPPIATLTLLGYAVALLII